jgi:hypothetical protein
VQEGVAVVHVERSAGAGFCAANEASAPASNNNEVRMRDTIPAARKERKAREYRKGQINLCDLCGLCVLARV